MPASDSSDPSGPSDSPASFDPASAASSDRITGPVSDAASAAPSGNTNPLARFIRERQLSRAPLALTWIASDNASPGTPRVVFKQFTPAFTALVEDRELFARRIAQIASRVEPHLATLHWSGWYDEQFYAAFAWHEHDPLDQFVDASQGQMPMAQRFGLVRDTALAVDALHRSALLHLALTPASFGVAHSTERRVRLIDWGLMLPAEAAQRSAAPFPGVWLDAAPYASAELLSGEPPTPSDDVYATSCIAHEVLSGTHPFERRLARYAVALSLRPTPISGLDDGQAKVLADGLALERSTRAPRLASIIAAFSTTAPVDPADDNVAMSGLPTRPAKFSWPILALALALAMAFTVVWRSTSRPASNAVAGKDSTEQSRTQRTRDESRPGSARAALPTVTRQADTVPLPASPKGDLYGPPVPPAPTGIPGLTRSMPPEPSSATPKPDTGAAAGPAATADPSAARMPSEAAPIVPSGHAATSKGIDSPGRIAAAEAAPSEPAPLLAAKPAAGTADCPRCDCATLEHKRTFTTDPMRPEEQRFLARNCKR